MDLSNEMMGFIMNDIRLKEKLLIIISDAMNSDEMRNAVTKAVVQKVTESIEAVIEEAVEEIELDFDFLSNSINSVVMEILKKGFSSI